MKNIQSLALAGAVSLGMFTVRAETILLGDGTTVEGELGAPSEQKCR